MSPFPPRARLGAGCAAWLLAAGAAAAGTITVVNPGFEDISGESPFNEFTFGPLNGWELHDPDVITAGGAGPTFYIGTLTPFEDDPIGNPGVFVNFPDGVEARVGIAFNFAGSGGSGVYGFAQTLNADLEPNTAYRLEVGVGNIATGVAMSGQEFVLDGFPGYRVELRAGTMLLDCDDNSLFGTIPEGEFATSTVTFITGADHAQLGQSLGIRLINLNEVDPAFPGSDLEVDFDRVCLTATPLSVCPDLDASGEVGVADLLGLLAVWGACVDCPEDLDGDDVVGVGDLLLLLAGWGPCV